MRAADDACSGRQRGESNSEAELLESPRSKGRLSSLKTCKSLGDNNDAPRQGVRWASAHLIEVKFGRHCC